MYSRIFSCFIRVFLSLLAGGSSAFAAPLEQTDVKEETQAEDITIEQGETFDPAFDFIGITVKDGERIFFLFCQQIKKESCLMQRDLEGMTVFTSCPKTFRRYL